LTELVDRCWRCGRTISEPLSVFVGMGPICREACGIVESRGWRALEKVGWWKEEPVGYEILVYRLQACLRWWRVRVTLVAAGSERLFDEADRIVDQLLITPPTEGLRVMGLLWKLVAQMRFILEPTLKTLQDAGVVPTRWVEGVPELALLVPSIEGLLCGLRATEDAVEFATVRAADRAKLQANVAVEPIEGLE
jgi:uncharacterized protein DUF6011